MKGEIPNSMKTNVLYLGYADFPEGYGRFFPDLKRAPAVFTQKEDGMVDKLIKCSITPADLEGAVSMLLGLEFLVGDYSLAFLEESTELQCEDQQVKAVPFSDDERSELKKYVKEFELANPEYEPLLSKLRD